MLDFLCFLGKKRPENTILDQSSGAVGNILSFIDFLAHIVPKNCHICNFETILDWKKFFKSWKEFNRRKIVACLK